MKKLFINKTIIYFKYKKNISSFNNKNYLY